MYINTAKFTTALIVMLIMCVTVSFTRASQGNSEQFVKVSSKDITIVDGDTIKVLGSNHRLMGFDTPEISKAKCAQEIAKGVEALHKLYALIVNAKTLELDMRGKDKYNRTLSILYVDSVDVAVIMIKGGYAAAYNGKTKRQSWCDTAS